LRGAGSVSSGQLPAALQDAGWPMNPVYVLDLGFVLPLLAATGIGLLFGRLGVERQAAVLLVFLPLLALSIVAMALGGAADGQSLEVVVLGIFAAVGLVGAALAWLAFEPGRPSAADVPTDGARLGAA
jgi:hypothetical protein